MKVPLNEKLTSVKLLMNGISHILYELHAVASEFRIIEQNVRHVLGWEESNIKIALLFLQTQHSVGNINWESKWWIWPSTVIYRQLNIADHFINTNVGAELDEQYQLPILRAVVDSYRDVVSRISQWLDDLSHRTRYSDVQPSSHLELRGCSYVDYTIRRPRVLAPTNLQNDELLGFYPSARRGGGNVTATLSIRFEGFL